MSKSSAISRSEKRKKNGKKSRTKSDTSTPSLGLQSRGDQSNTVKEEEKNNNNIENGLASPLEACIKNVVPVGLPPTNGPRPSRPNETNCCLDEDGGWKDVIYSKKPADLDQQIQDGVETYPLKLVEGKAKESNNKVEPNCTGVMPYMPAYDSRMSRGEPVRRHSKTKVKFQNELSDFPPLEGKSPRRSSHGHSESAEKLLGISAIDQENPEETDLAFGDLDKSSVKAVYSDLKPSPLYENSPKSKKKTKKWSKLDLHNVDSGSQSRMLAEGVVYEAVVVETKQTAFIAVVEQEIRVLVYGYRFKPRGSKTPLQKDVPITCVLKVGDCVRLTAMRKKSPSQYKYGEKWVAKECWQERPMLAHGSNQEVSYQSTVKRVGIRAVQLTDGTYVFADVIFLFGFHLAHADVDLRCIFQLGDQLTYTLPHDTNEHSGPSEAAKSWFGSLPADGNDKPSNQQQFELISFFKARNKDIPMSIITAVCGLNKNARCAKDNFEDVYGDIFSTEDQMLPTMHTDSTTINEGRLIVGAERQNNVKKTSTKGVSMQQLQHVEMKNKIDPEMVSSITLSMASTSMGPESTAKSQMVDVATQTHATGDLMCFYSMYSGDSD